MRSENCDLGAAEQAMFRLPAHTAETRQLRG